MDLCFVLVGRRGCQMWNDSWMQSLGATCARYVVTNLDEPGSPRELAGSQLVQDGLAIVIRDKPGAALPTYRRKK